MNWSIIGTLIVKDFILFLRDKFFGIMTVLSILLYVVFYFVMPKSVDETLEIAVHAPQIFYTLLDQQQIKGFVLTKVVNEEELKQAVIEKKYQFGISIPDNFQTLFFSGNTPQIKVYFSSELPTEIKEMYPNLMGEMFFGNLQTNVEFVETVLGPDMGGKQIPIRDRLLALFIFTLLIMETFGLANLITSELENETAQALLVTPMKVSDLFIGKGLTGILLGFSQVVLFLIIIGNLTHNISLVLVTLLLGTMMLTGLAFFVASISKDMMSVVAWSTLFMLILSIPAVSIIFPGLITGWIKIIPSFFIVDTLHKALNFSVGWSGNLNNILLLIGYNIIFITLGILTLRRRMM